MPDNPKDEVGSFERPRVTFGIPPSAPVVACRSCRAPIVWIVTAAGKRMPVNYLREGAAAPARGESHFATCPDAGRWRT